MTHGNVPASPKPASPPLPASHERADPRADPHEQGGPPCPGRHTFVHGSLAHNVWFLLGPCEDVCGTASYGASPRALGPAVRSRPVHLRFPASYTELKKAQKDSGATLPESSAQQNSPHEYWSGRSCGTIRGSSGIREGTS